MSNSRIDQATKRKLVLVGSVATVVVVSVVYKRNISAAKTIAATTAVESWVDQNARAGFNTYILTQDAVKHINSLTNNALPHVTAA